MKKRKGPPDVLMCTWQVTRRVLIRLSHVESMSAPGLEGGEAKLQPDEECEEPKAGARFVIVVVVASSVGQLKDFDRECRFGVR